MDGIFKLANDIANNMSEEDKGNMENMDMEKMIQHVTKNVFGMMNNGELNSGNGNIVVPELPSKSNNKPSSKSSKEKSSKSKKPAQKTKDIFFDLDVDLQDFYRGKNKKLNVKVKRTVTDEDGNEGVVEEKKRFIVKIEKGMKDEDQIVFRGEADQIPGYEPGDIVINLVENEHPEFERDGDNLVFMKDINFYQAYDFTFDIVHLNGKVIRIVKELEQKPLHLDNCLRKITGKGMPIQGGNEYGDLYIRFNITAPPALDSEKVLLLKQVFDQDELTVNHTLHDEAEVTDTCILEYVSENELYDSDDSEDSESDDSDDSDDSEDSESDDSDDLD